ncbi:MAG: DNA-binding protein [Clostridia bacterium]|nr:DNA-binding protein [Clostridia bacterium]
MDRSERLRLSVLFDEYKKLLTDKQSETFDLYVNSDLSLNEIADGMSISKQAVRDSLQNTEKLLNKYEDALELTERKNALRALLHKLELGEMSVEEYKNAVSDLL